MLNNAELEIIRTASDLYDQGQYIQAFRVGEPLGSLGKWPSVEGRLIAGKLAYQLGRPSWGRALHQLAIREYPTHPRAIYYGSLALRARRGPLRTWLDVRNVNLPTHAHTKEKADWLAFKASLLGTLRDFHRAANYISAARDLDANSPWILLASAELSHRRDHHDEAIALVNQALTLHPWYRPAIQSLAELLLEANQDEQAVDLLEQATLRLECPSLWAQLARIYLDVERYENSLHAVEKYEQTAIIAPKNAVEGWSAMMRATAHYQLGNTEDALHFARKVDSPSYQKLAHKLEASLKSHIDIRNSRKKLPVSFVRQHHLTCAPATLAAIAQYWNKVIRHEEIAARICYDGTQSHDERTWASENGFLAREFRITDQAAKQLIDAQIPFTLTTINLNFGHLQAVIGYDSLSEVLLIRDPSTRSLIEATTDKLLEHQASSGPRGMALAPIELSERLSSIALPEAELYDLQYQIDVALNRHDHDAASCALQSMLQIDPTHRLTLQSKLSVARYDGQLQECQSITRSLQEMFPNDLRLLLCQIDQYLDFSSRKERIDLLEGGLQKFGPNTKLKLRLATELLDDWRQHSRTEQEFKWLLRWASTDAQVTSQYSRLLWDHKLHDQAVELSRLTACLEDKNEGYAKSFFQLAHQNKQTDEAIDWLKQRHVTWQNRLCEPSITLAWAYEELQQHPKSLEVIQTALDKHPDDGLLLCYAALKFDRYGQPRKADEYLQRASGKCHPNIALRTAAEIARNRGNLNDSYELYSQLIVLDAADWFAYDNLTELDYELDNIERGEPRLREALARWPRCRPLQERLIHWLRLYRPDGLQQELSLALENEPNNAWLHREAAIAALQRTEREVALIHALRATELEPQHVRNWEILAQVRMDRGERYECRSAAFRALQCSIDSRWAIDLLISSCRDQLEYETALSFVFDHLKSQTSNGDGILAYQQVAQGHITTETLYRNLREFLDDRPDLWQAWSAVIHQKMHIGDTAAAIDLAVHCTEQYPLLVDAWLDLAKAYHLAGREDQELTTLEEAFRMSPASAQLARKISDIHITRQELVPAETVLRNSLIRNPRDSITLGYLADVLWAQHRQDDALQTIQKAASLSPGYDWAWHMFQSWGDEMLQSDLVLKTAQQILTQRPGSHWGYVRQGQYYLDHALFEDAIRMAKNGLVLHPLNIRLNQLHALALEGTGRYAEALLACRPQSFGNELPAELMLLESELLYRRHKTREAINRLRDSLRVNPSSSEGWRLLAEWTETHGHHQLHLEACQRLAGITPNDPIYRGLLAAAFLKDSPSAGNLQQAKEHLQFALKLDPSYDYATFELFFIYLSEGDYANALALTQQTSIKLSAANLESMRLLVFLTSQSIDRKDALMHWSQQNEVEHTRECIRRGLALAPTSGLAEVIVDLWKANPNRPGLGMLWVELNMGRIPVTEIVRLFISQAMGSTWHRAFQCLLDLPNELKFPQKCVKKICSARHQEIKQNPSSWHAVAEYYLAQQSYPELFSWCRNWKTIPLEQSSQLTPAILGYWFCRMPQRAREITQHAIMLPNANNQAALVWYALDRIFLGEYIHCKQILGNIDKTSLNNWHQTLLQQVEALLHVCLTMEQTPEHSIKKKLYRSLAHGEINGFSSPPSDWQLWLAGEIRLQLARRHKHWREYFIVSVRRMLN